jgi:hypothetical protein
MPASGKPRDKVNPQAPKTPDDRKLEQAVPEHSVRSSLVEWLASQITRDADYRRLWEHTFQHLLIVLVSGSAGALGQWATQRLFDPKRDWVSWAWYWSLEALSLLLLLIAVATALGTAIELITGRRILPRRRGRD